MNNLKLIKFHVMRQPVAQKGLSLIEVLVSLVIFALGMLGAGGLLMSSLRSGQYSGNASVGTGLARDYGELMQLIPSNTANTAAAATSSFTIDTDSTDVTAPSLNCQASACTPSEFVSKSTWDWTQRVKTELPGGRAVICKDSTPKGSDGLYNWVCDGTGDLMVMKIGWTAKTGPAGTGDDILSAKDADDVFRPKMVVVLFGNQTDFVP